MRKTNAAGTAQPERKVPVVIYARYSSSGQRDESIEGQLRDCHEFCRQHNYQVISEYVDRALTGTSDRRPDFQRMIKDSERRLFECVIVWKLDRFSRNKYDTAIYKNKLKKNGVRVLSAKEVIPEGPEGTILESIMEGFAQYYSENLSQNVKRGLYDNALQRKTIQGLPPLGYRFDESKHFVIYEAEAEVVRRIFAEFSQGIPAKQIYTKLNNEGYRTSRGGPFNKNSLTRILQNEKYIGVYRYADIYDPEGIPAIVPPETFEKCQILLKRHRIAPAASRDVTYFLTGKIFCGECESALVGESATSKTGTRHYYYFCNGRRNHNCTLPRLKKDEIEKIVLDILNTYIHDDAFIDYVSDKAIEYQEKQDLHARLKELQRMQRENERKIQNVMKAIDEGLVTSSTKNHLLELEKERDTLTLEIHREELREPELTKEQITFFLKRFRETVVKDDLYQHRIIDMFLKAVYIFKDGTGKILINFTDKEIKIDLNELKKCADGSDLESSRSYRFKIRMMYVCMLYGKNSA